ncbi:MAG: hypothetical protein CR988_02285 [Treponema sp.]|nr:MAG: hypothetical protein CR988_02285 [Treponema sp.]
MAYTNDQLGKALEDLTIAYNNFKQGFSEAVKLALTNTVIAEIKQDAKDFIASELVTQKANLELAIKQAKQAINNYVASSKVNIESFCEEKKQELEILLETATASLNEIFVNGSASIDSKVESAGVEIDNKVAEAGEVINGKIDEIKNIVKEYFIKYFMSHRWVQGAPYEENGVQKFLPKPSDVFSFDGYRWKEIPRYGRIERGTGGLALPFGTGEQGDAIRNITGYFGMQACRLSGIDGAFSYESVTAGNDGNSNGYDFIARRVAFDASKVVPTAEENRMVNDTVRHWILEKL